MHVTNKNSSKIFLKIKLDTLKIYIFYHVKYYLYTINL